MLSACHMTMANQILQAVRFRISTFHLVVERSISSTRLDPILSDPFQSHTREPNMIFTPHIHIGIALAVFASCLSAGALPYTSSIEGRGEPGTLLGRAYVLHTGGSDKTTTNLFPNPDIADIDARRRAVRFQLRRAVDSRGNRHTPAVLLSNQGSAANSEPYASSTMIDIPPTATAPSSSEDRSHQSRPRKSKKSQRVRHYGKNRSARKKMKGGVQVDSRKE